MSSITTKFAILSAFGLAFLGMTAASADAAPRNTGATYASAKKQAVRQINREFNQLDVQKNGVLNKRDFTSYSVKWVRVGRKWKKVRRPIVSAQYRRVLRIADFNHNGKVTRSEYRRAKLATYISNYMPRRRVVVVTNHRTPPAPPRSGTVRDRRTPPAPPRSGTVRNHRTPPAPAPTRRGAVRDHRAPSAPVATGVVRIHGSISF